MNEQNISLRHWLDNHLDDHQIKDCLTFWLILPLATVAALFFSASFYEALFLAIAAFCSSSVILTVLSSLSPALYWVISECKSAGKVTILSSLCLTALLIFFVPALKVWILLSTYFLSTLAPASFDLLSVSCSLHALCFLV